MSAELVLNAGNSKWWGFASEDMPVLRQLLENKVAESPDFWSVVGQIEWRIYEALADRRLAKVLDGILADLADVKARAYALLSWASVSDQAQFVLSPYVAARAVSATERAAAQKLLAQLEQYAMS